MQTDEVVWKVNQPEKIVPDIVPQWVNSEDGQKLHVPDSDEDTIVARAGSARSMCCNILIFSGEFVIDWKERSAVTRLTTKENVEEFCKKAYENNLETVQKVRFM